MLLHEVHPFPAGHVTAPSLSLLSIIAGPHCTPALRDVRPLATAVALTCGPDHTSASLPVAVIRAARRVRGMGCRAGSRDWLFRLPVRAWTSASWACCPIS